MVWHSNSVGQDATRDPQNCRCFWNLGKQKCPQTYESSRIGWQSSQLLWPLESDAAKMLTDIEIAQDNTAACLSHLDKQGPTPVSQRKPSPLRMLQDHRAQYYPHRPPSSGPFLQRPLQYSHPSSGMLNLACHADRC